MFRTSSPLRALALVLPALLASPAAAQSSWIPTETVKITHSIAGTNHHFGSSVSISGDTAVVGTPVGGGQLNGAVYVFERDRGGPGAWGEVAMLTASDSATYDSFGRSVSISGDTVVVGAPESDPSGLWDAGSAYVFQRHQGGPNAWGEVAKLTPSDAAQFDWFGISVAVAGDTVVIGAMYKDIGAGAAYVFQRDQGGPGAWGQVKRLAPTYVNKNNRFGNSVAIHADTVVVGAHSAYGLGAAFVFERDLGGPDAWGEWALLLASDGWFSGDYFGEAVGICGDTIVVGAYSTNHMNPGLIDAGSAYVYERNAGGPGGWGEVKKLNASDWASYDEFGRGVAVSGDTIVVGAWWDDHSGGTDAGSAYVFERDRGGPGTWGQAAKLTASDADAGDEFGRRVALSGATAIVGAWKETRWPKVRVGAAYAFEGLSPPQTYCTAGTTSNQCRATMSLSGTPSLSGAGPVKLMASGVEGNKLGLLFYGISGRARVLWGQGSSSFLCVKAPTQRTPPQNSGGNSGACNGLLAVDWSDFVGSNRQKPINQSLRLGIRVQAQAWFRDPPSPRTTSLSDAIEFQVGP